MYVLTPREFGFQRNLHLQFPPFWIQISLKFRECSMKFYHALLKSSLKNRYPLWTSEIWFVFDTKISRFLLNQEQNRPFWRNFYGLIKITKPSGKAQENSQLKSYIFRLQILYIFKSKLLSNSVTLSVGFELKLWSAWWSDFTEILTRWSVVFILATWKIFPITEDVSRAKKRKNKAVFRNFETSVNLYEIFHVMKVVGKIRVAIFHIGRIVYFHFRLFLEFSD